MKLQAAIDRIAPDRVWKLLDELNGQADILEMGTSYTKEFGVAFLREMRARYPQAVILADIKTMDEAKYEFDLYYEAGADILTVMGAAALDTIQIARQCAQTWQRRYCIDLLGLDDADILRLHAFDDAIFCMHLPSDSHGDLEALLKRQIELLPQGAVIAAAGGIRPDQLPLLKQVNMDIAVIGSAVTGSDDPRAALQAFRK